MYDTANGNHYGVPYNIFPLQPGEMPMFPLVYLPYHHDRQRPQVDEQTYYKPSYKSHAISLINSNERLKNTIYLIHYQLILIH